MMASDQETSLGGIVLCVLAVPVWVVQLALLSDLNSSDAAGNGLAQAFAAIAIIVLWMLLAGIVLLATVRGAVSSPVGLAALILIPASGFVAMKALGLLSAPEVAPFLWPIAIPAGVPILVVAYGLWAFIPAFRAAIPANATAAIVWGGVLLLCVAIVPLVQMRTAVEDQEDAAREKWAADFARLPEDSPLWDWVPLLQTRDATRSDTVLDRIRALPRRQSDSEIMLDRGDFPLLYLARFDLDPTPSLCDKARGLLQRQVRPLVLKTSGSKPYSDVAAAVDAAVSAMDWLVGHECRLDDEALAWETMAKAYRDTNFDVYRLAELRDPKIFGRIVREYPERFSMLTPAAHLKAWLKFAENKETRAAALDGARKLDRRNADALEMLNGDEHSAYLVMAYLPMLDLDATPPLCAAVLRLQHADIAIIYHPRAEDPRQFRELESRLGDDEPFPALAWIARHGCDTETAVTEAEDLIRAYQDSPRRTAALAHLAQLHRKP